MMAILLRGFDNVFSFLLKTHNQTKTRLITSPTWLAGLICLFGLFVFREFGSGIGDRGKDGAAYIEANNQKQNRLFGVELRKSGELIGLCGLLQRDYLNVRDIGYAIEESFQGFQI